jgi:DNA invertase Pin-like site-specific DNA recombinase
MKRPKNSPNPPRFDQKTAQEIRQKILTDQISYRALAKGYNCSISTIHLIYWKKGAYECLK